MAIRFIQCTTTAQAQELLDAGLLWVNQDRNRNRSQETAKWEPAISAHTWYLVRIDTNYKGTPGEYWGNDFAYALED